MSPQYSNIAKVLHWLVAGLIVCQYLLAEFAKNARANDELLQQLGLLANHKSVGMTILVIALIRLLYRWRHPVPALPAAMPDWQCKISNASHFLLYTFLFALPISGWLMSSASAYSVSWFNLIALPDLVGPSESLASKLVSLHYYLGKALLILAIFHIVAALKHHFLDKDDVLSRMAGRKSYAFFILVSAVSVYALSQIGTQTGNDKENQKSTASVEANEASDLPLWQIDYDNSFIKFSGDQAGAPFEGEWQEWQGQIQFDANNLKASNFDVRVNPASPFSNDKERDDTIRSADFFDVEQFGQARFAASRFEKTKSGFKADGVLEMKSLSHPVELNFKVIEINGQYQLTGHASLDRLLWNIGTGDWSNTDWVGQEIKVDVKVVSK